MEKSVSSPGIVGKIIKITLAVLGVILAAALIYVAYVFLSYSRIEDPVTLVPSGSAEEEAVSVGTEYTVVTQNLGFGAYTRDFTFFMDGGEESRARSAASVVSCITKGAQKVASFSPDFIFFQEVDLNATRSFHINQSDMLTGYFPGYVAVSAVNYHSAYLLYPILKPHGASVSSILTLSRFTAKNAVRRSLPISTGVSKLLDLDRCYSVTRIAVENGKELVLYNVHASAYGGSDEVRSAQMTMLLSDMKAEYEEGNYCVCGGDFNHDFTGDSTQVLNGGLGTLSYGWAQPFPADLIPEGITRAMCYDGDETNPSCRNCDIPYTEGNFVIIVDGFLVSDNVEITSLQNVVTGFEYSDHNPVVMSFRLN